MLLYSPVPYHNDTIIKTHAGITDAMIKTQKDFFIKIFTSHFIARVQKGYSRFASEKELETEHNWNIWPQSYGRQRCVFLVLLWTPIQSGLPRAPSAGCGFPCHISTLAGTRTQLSSSVQFVGLILPSNSHAVIWTRLHTSAISSDIRRSGCVTSAIYGTACVIVIERK